MLTAFDPYPTYRVTRRAALTCGALGAVGLSLPQLLAAEARARPARAKSIILVVPWGGPAQVDTLDLKPDAPAEVRGEFKPIATTVPGVRVCEHMPNLARLAGYYALVRSVSHRIGTHNSATHYALTGHPPAVINRELVPASRADFPCIGSVLAKLRPTDRALPAYVQLPLPLIDNGVFSGGQNAGFLGTSFDPFVVSQDPSKKDFAVNGLALPAGVDSERLAGRRALLGRLEGRTAASADPVRDLASYTERAYDLLSSAVSKRAFDLGREPEALRERYGMTRFGQSVLLARRLVEAGVRLVLVGDTMENTNDKWDTHNGGYANIKKHILETDRGLAALLGDLRDRGLLQTTLVVWMAEFGRSPRMTPKGGRDHWPHCYSLLVAGGGIKGGQVYGSSDKIAAHPRENPVPPEDVHATFYHALGLRGDTTIADPFGRPMPLCTGRPLAALLA